MTSPTEPTKRNCPICDEPIKGRRDKKYCSDYCRSVSFNENNRDSTSFVKTINTILRKNRKILEQLNPKGKSKASKKQLLDEGFNFNYFTNEYITKTGKVYKFCYEQGYIALPEDMFALVVKHEYID